MRDFGTTRILRRRSLSARRSSRGSIGKVVIVLVVAVFEAIGDHHVDLVLNEIIRQFIKVEFKGIELSGVVEGSYDK